MIFATVGTQLPFARLIDALEQIAPGIDEEIVAQIGETRGSWPHLTVKPTLSPAEFGALFAQARVVVAHAGVGTILSAKSHGKPLVVLPRQHKLGEHRNDHQLATAKQLGRNPGIYVASGAEDLERLLRDPELAPMTDGPTPARDALVGRLKGFIDG